MNINQVLSFKNYHQFFKLLMISLTFEHLLFEERMISTIGLTSNLMKAKLVAGSGIRAVRFDE